MRTPPFCLIFAGTTFLVASSLWAQFPLNPSPSRVVGHALVKLSTTNPNLVEGRELYSPQGVAIDTAATPPVLYVSDSGNNRILAWRNAAQFSSGAKADFIIGQKDPYTTFAQGPGTAFSAGLNSPTGLAVRNGDLYVVDSGNNRVLRFPKPAVQTDQFPDFVIGQPDFNSSSPNQGSTNPGPSTLALAANNNVYRAALAFDSEGNLWVTDSGNNRVLRFPASAIASGSNNGPSANLLLGQVDFTSVAVALPVSNISQQVKDRLQVPAGLAFDASGRLYVSDGLSRVLVFEPGLSSGKAARRVLGVVLTPAQGQPPVPQATLDRTLMADPEGIFFLGTTPAVIDALYNRILLFDPYDSWPDETVTYSPMPKAVVGQAQTTDFSSRKANSGQPEPSASTLTLPVAAAIAGNELFVTDSGNHRVLVMPFQGDSIAPATRVLGQNDMPFGSPNLIEGREFDFVLRASGGSLADAAVSVDQNSDPPHLYVADPYNNRVLGFRDVRKIRPGDVADLVIGQPDMFRSVCNYPNGDINKPTASSLCFYRTVGSKSLVGGAALALDSNGDLFVADTGNGRVLRFPSPFQHQGTLPQADLILGQTSLTSSIFDPSTRTMGAPSGLALAGDHGLLVSDLLHNRVLFFPKEKGAYTNGEAATKVFGQPDFTTVTASSSTPEGNRMNGPRHVAVDSDGRPYVADTNNGRVLIFDVVASMPDTDARAVVTLTGLSSPRGIYVGAKTGEIWVTDTGRSQSLRYPGFQQLPFNSYAPNLAIPAASAALDVTQDQYGDLFVADATNRVAIHYAGLTALNSANFIANRALSPGMLASVYPAGNPFGDQTKANTDLPNPLPLPTELADIQVTVNDTLAPLYYVSPNQVNLMVPTNAPASGMADLTVLRKSTGQILGTSPIPMNDASPGLFTANATGKGPAVAYNSDGTLNSPTNPAARNTDISLFGTGSGPVAGGPADGEVAQGPTSTPDVPKVFIEPCFVDDSGCGSKGVKYSGLAPALVGVWQITVEIPNSTVPGPSRSVVVFYHSIPSNAVTIAVK